jgi:L-threonylcarbamoyladenylate synthase
MKTIILEIDPEKPQREKILSAAEVIRNGGLVAFPTETVYGLGASALNPKALKRIYKVKNRPLDNPIIIHVSEKEEVYRLSEMPEIAFKLIKVFWPGPLTLIAKASKTVPKVTRSGLKTIALRMPNHKVALELIRESGVAISAPSANISGRPSPTRVEHVKHDLYGKIDMIISSGPTQVGLESTVLDLTTFPPLVLRPGGLVLEELKKVIADVKLYPDVFATSKPENKQVRSPGIIYRHYAPNAKVIVVEGSLDVLVKKVQTLAYKYMKMYKKVGILASSETKQIYKADTIKSFGSRNNFKSVANKLFNLFREFDKEKVDIIIAEGIASKDLGLAVMNRLRKAAAYNIIKVE